MFSIVSFDADTLGLVIIRSSWILKDKPYECFYPMKSKDPTVLLKKSEVPDPKWPVKQITRLYATNLGKKLIE